MRSPIAFGTAEVTSMAELLRAQALAWFARTVDETIVSLGPEHRAALLNRWQEKHGLDEFKIKSLLFLQLLGDYSARLRD